MTVHIVIAELKTTWLIIGVFTSKAAAEAYAAERHPEPQFRRIEVVSRKVQP